MATPVIRLLKTELDAETHILIHEKNGCLMENNPYLDIIHFNKSSLLKLRNELKMEKFNWVIDLQNDAYSKLVRFNISEKSQVFSRHLFLHWLYVKTKINKLPKAHLIEQYLAMLKPLGIKGDSLGLDFFIPEKDEVENEWLPETHQDGYAAIAIHASHNTKKLPINRLIELCDRINKPIILIGEAEDQSVANEVVTFFKQGTAEEEKAIEGLNKKTIIFDACGKFSFHQSASLIRKANWVFTYDNVMMHIASVFKKPLFTMWGSTTPHFGTYPYRTQFTVFENNKLNCRPCTKTGYNNCPKGHFKCMNEMKFDFYLPD